MQLRDKQYPIQMYVFSPKDSWGPEEPQFCRSDDASLEHDQSIDEQNSEHESDAKPLEFPISLGSISDGKLQLKQAVKEETRNKRENQKTRRGYGKKNARKNIKHVKFSLLGANSNCLLMETRKPEKCNQ